MKKLLGLVAVTAAITAMTGCVIPNDNAITASLIMDGQKSAPFVDNSVKPLKCGTATVSGIMLFTKGDASIGAAMKNGGITKVHHIDYKVKTFFYCYSTYTTMVWGE